MQNNNNEASWEANAKEEEGETPQNVEQNNNEQCIEYEEKRNNKNMYKFGAHKFTLLRLLSFSTVFFYTQTTIEIRAPLYFVCHE